MTAPHRKRTPDFADVVVIGGGPAGATAAGLLASWGWSVVLVYDGSPRPNLAESLPGGARSLFDFLGQTSLVDAASFYPNRGNVSVWAGRETTTTTDVDGYHVARRSFDRVLRQFARAAGASLVIGKAVGISRNGPFRVTITRASGAQAAQRGRYVLDCSGRAGVATRGGAALRRQNSGYRTVAIVSEWDCQRNWPADEDARTFVESYQDGWAWAVPLSRRRRQCTVMVDPSSIDRRAGLASAYARELEKAGALAGRLRGARQTIAPWACDASPYEAAPAAEDGLFLVGDAASFVDPLSSGGVRKALLSAWRAAVVANTCLARPERSGPAVDFYNRRERMVSAACRRQAAEFFGAARAEYAHPFWVPRADPGADVPAGYDHEITERDLASDAEVREQFASLRDTPTFRLKPGSSVRFASVAAIEGREVVLREAVVLPHLTIPVRFTAGVNLPALVHLAPHVSGLSGFVDAYRRSVGQIAPGNVLAGLSLLVAHRVLVFDGPGVAVSRGSLTAAGRAGSLS